MTGAIPYKCASMLPLRPEIHVRENPTTIRNTRLILTLLVEIYPTVPPISPGTHGKSTIPTSQAPPLPRARIIIPHTPGVWGGGICRLSISRFCQVMIISPTGKSELVNRKEFTGDGERGVYWRWRLPKSSFHYLGIVRILLLITDR